MIPAQQKKCALLFLQKSIKFNSFKMNIIILKQI